MENWDYQRIKENVVSRLKLELPEYLTYHDVAHTIEVTNKVNFLASLHSISKENTDLIKIAALYHDIGFILGKDKHEENSCLIASKDLSQINLSQNHIDKVCNMIMATKIPQNAEDVSQQIIADADLFYLGTELYDYYSDKLFVELKHFSPSLSQTEWLDIQIDFMQQHQFYTQYGKTVLDPTKQFHLNRLKTARRS
jgi:uncharacterized protein